MGRYFEAFLKTMGWMLQMLASNQREILLRGMDLNATGYYTCEVSTETPIYTKASDDILVTVYGKSN